MRNITVSVDDEVFRRARVAAAEADTSVSKLVEQFLADLAARYAKRDELIALQDATLREIHATRTFSAAERITRDELYDRHARIR